MIRLKHFLKSISIEVVSKLAGYSFLGDSRQQFQIRENEKTVGNRESPF